jgi:dTMP kinase
MYYCANRRFELPWMNEVLNSGKHLILDRYVDSNKACQGGKERDPEKRLELYNAFDFLEYNFAQLPRPDITVVLHMPYQIGIILKSQMEEKKDQVEEDINYLQNQEMAYLELAKIHGWPVITCFPQDKVSSVKTHEDVMKYIKPFDEIHKEVWTHVKKNLESIIK